MTSKGRLKNKFKEFIFDKINGNLSLRMWNLETNYRLAKQKGFLDIDLMLVSAFGVNIWGIILLINLRLVTDELEWGVCCVCVTLI